MECLNPLRLGVLSEAGVSFMVSRDAGCHDLGVFDKVVLNLVSSPFRNRSLHRDLSKTRPCRRRQDCGTQRG